MVLIKYSVASVMLATFLTISSVIATAQGLVTKTIKGNVRVNERGVENVPVTDGFNYVYTDANGNYSIVSPLSAKFVYISTPSAYNVSLENGSIPLFFQVLEDGKDAYDFQLTNNIKDGKKHSFIVQADAQVTSKNDLKQFQSIVADIKNTVKLMDGLDVFGFDCGDIVGDSPWLFPDYIKRTSSLKLPFFRVVGNHDMDYRGRTHETSHHTFEKYFGPDHYSFNRGDAHYIVVNNNFFVGRDYFYMGYVDEATFQWLEQDLKNVPKESLVFVFMHIPASLTPDIKPFVYDYMTIADQTVNAGAFKDFFKDYNVHLITGHMHYNLNIEASDHFYEHNTASACGTWWQVPECMDGSPRGYAVYEVDGSDVSWYYKGAGYDRDYQMRVYSIGECEEYPNDVVVNVWNYDSKWEVVLLEDGRVTAIFERFTGFDPLSKEHCCDRSKVKYDWISPVQNKHMFHATPVNSKAKLQVRVTDRFGNVYIQDVKKL
ncbi:MAG: calcineurin-like phosphoesterase C-terminal domain-containing protein [Breznakibacter sp.]